MAMAVAAAATDIAQRGWAVLPSVLTLNECGAWVAELDRLVEATPGARNQMRESGTPRSRTAAFGHTAVVQHIFNKSPLFEEVYRRPAVVELVRHFLGEDAQLSSCEGRVRYPGSPAQHLHADASVTGSNAHPAPAADVQRGLGRITRHVLGMNAVFCLSDFRADQGTTLMFGGTHALPDTELPPESELLGPGRGTLVEAAAGSVLLWDVNLWHGASAHEGSAPRHAVFSLWRRSWLRPQFDLASVVSPEVLHRAGPYAQAIFGVSTRPATGDHFTSSPREPPGAAAGPAEQRARKKQWYDVLEEQVVEIGGGREQLRAILQHKLRQLEDDDEDEQSDRARL